VVGCSRLPLTSVDAPIPAFTLGELAYIHRPGGHAESQTRPMRCYRDLIANGLDGGLDQLEQAKLLEIVVRSTPPAEIGDAAKEFFARWQQLGSCKRHFLAMARRLFNEVALSPYTDFVEKLLAFLHGLVDQGCIDLEDQIDFLSYLLRQTSRHLTAYDLITFHHRGANYPDALLIDTVLKSYRAFIATYPDSFLDSVGDETRARYRKQVHRRALRQGWLLRCLYEGLPVPAAPTSPGENSRVLPPPHVRVPEEEILNPAKRTRRLFDRDALTVQNDQERAVLRQSLADLRHPEELQELGMAIFLDRPLGAFKHATEPDHTILLSYEAFSKHVAERRFDLLRERLGPLLESEQLETHRQNLHSIRLLGIPVRSSATTVKPGTVSIEDARKAADDFVLLRTTTQAVREFVHQYDFGTLGERLSLGFLTAERSSLIVRASAAGVGRDGVLAVFDADMRQCLELEVDSSQGYQRRGGSEFPRAGLRVLRYWSASEESGELRVNDVRGAAIAVRPRN
jgi:hypothetical protein